jgi:UPF0716 family protein affecting phage T7 exclusion
MSKLLSRLAYLPLIELIGFFVIGGRIGFFNSVLWIICATAFGFHLLKTGALKAMQSPDGDDNLFALRDGFDSLCILIAALLLIFPGFVSDIIAIPFLAAPVRSWLFGHSQKNPDSYMHTFTRESREFREWTYTKTNPPGDANAPLIDGEFKRMDDENDKLPRP